MHDKGCGVKIDYKKANIENQNQNLFLLEDVLKNRQNSDKLVKKDNINRQYWE